MKSKEEEMNRAILDSLPGPRLKPFLDAAKGDVADALDLYAWNAQMAGAALEQLSHLEVLLRNAIDVQLSREVNEVAGRIPWFLLTSYNSTQADAIETVRKRLHQLNRETRDQIVAGLSFGFWSGWFGPKYDELWRRTLHRAFPHGSGKRKDVSVLVEQTRKFRNRVAHHDSLLNVDVKFEMETVFRLANMISVDAANWMKAVDRTQEVGSKKPIKALDTVVIPGNRAWSLYEKFRAFICQPGRYFQEVKYIAFYSDRKVKSEVPRIKARHDHVEWNEGEAARLLESEVRADRKLGKVMQGSLQDGLGKGKYQVFILSSPGDPDHVTLSHPPENFRQGKVSASVPKQRYTSIHQLRHKDSVWDL